MKAIPQSDAREGESVADVAVPAEPVGDPPPTSPTDLLPPGSAKHQLLAAYVAAGAKVIAWVVAAAVVYRMMGPGPFALFMLLRGTLGLLNYTAFGLGPAVLHFGSGAGRIAEAPNDAAPEADRSLAYERLPRSEPVSAPRDEIRIVLLNAAALTILLLVAGLILLNLYERYFLHLHELPSGAQRGQLLAVGWLGIGVLLRATGDVAGGASQARGWFTLDQLASALADLLWASWCFWTFWGGGVPSLPAISAAYAATGGIAALSRWGLAIALVASIKPKPQPTLIRERFSGRFAMGLLSFGALVTLGSVADWLYAPIDYVILNRLVDPLAVAVYAPAVQIDAALILLVNAIAAVILPRAAIRHAADDRAGVWREYVRGVVGAAGITLVGALLAWSVSGSLFELWLGDEMVGTQAILPLVLLHTVLGSGGGVGRSTMLAMGRAGTYAASVLAGGLLNIILSVAFVYAGLGLSGVILGTVISIALRCVLWMPWYIRRALKR